jgi:hypothetical protein
LDLSDSGSKPVAGSQRFMNTERLFGFHKMLEISFVAERLFASQQGIRSMDLVS